MIARRIIDEVWNRGEIRNVTDLIAKEFVMHRRGQRITGGPDLVAGSIMMTRASFPDLVASIDTLIAEDDCVAMYLTITGTHTGDPFYGIQPSGREIRIAQTGILRFESGKAAESWMVLDELALMEQLGARMPRPR
ncbi:MAG TPA: ester cyclase [Acidimicrobiales bacterium]|nr:ester cyclase [Acidimicrobiales bacterium]